MGLCGPYRQRAQQVAVHCFSQRLPGHRRAHARRALGAAHHPARGAPRKPAPRGRKHCGEQGCERNSACSLGRGAAPVHAGPRRAVPRIARPQPAGRLPHAALAAPCGGAQREHVCARALDRTALPQRAGADRRGAERAGRGQPHCRQHHHYSAHDRPGRVERPDRTRQPFAASAARAAELRGRKRTNAPADHARNGAHCARQRPVGARGGKGRGATGGRRVGRRCRLPFRPRRSSRRRRRLLPLRPRACHAACGASIRCGGGPRCPPDTAAQLAQPRLALACLCAIRRAGHLVAARGRRTRVATPSRLDHVRRHGTARMATLRGIDRIGAAHHVGVGARAGAASSRFCGRDTRTAPHPGRHSHAAELDSQQRATGPQARAALARKPRGARPVCAADRLGRRAPSLAARRHAAARRCRRAHRGAQRKILRAKRHGTALSAAASPAQLERHRRALDGLGAQARQARNADAPPGDRTTPAAFCRSHRASEWPRAERPTC